VPSPTYQRIADDLRRSILDGTLPPGARLPSRHDLARQYQVSDRVGLEAVRLLIAEGVRGGALRVRVLRAPPARDAAHDPVLVHRPARRLAVPRGDERRRPPWHLGILHERAPMTPAVAERLSAQPGDPAMRTRYTYLADGEPVMLAESWEPAGLTTGTAIMFPEEGPHAGRGVVERMAVIGQHITHAEEAVSARPALAAEAERLRIRPGAVVLTIARTYHTSGQPAETADIVLPVERYALVYEIPVA